jgi:hypothetical protein
MAVISDYCKSVFHRRRWTLMAVPPLLVAGMDWLVNHFTSLPRDLRAASIWVAPWWEWAIAILVCFSIAQFFAWHEEYKKVKVLENADFLAHKHSQIKEMLGIVFANGQNLALQSEWAPIDKWRQDLKRLVAFTFGDAEASLFDDEALAMRTWDVDKSRIRLSALLDNLKDLIARSSSVPFSQSSTQHAPSDDKQA